MKKLLLTLTFAIISIFAMQAQVTKSVDVTSARLSTLISEVEITTVTDLTITAGEVTAEDITFIGTMTALTSLNMQEATTTNNTVVGFSYYNLKSIVLPRTTLIIDRLAFKACSQLASIIIPDGVTTLGEECFTNCRAIESIILPNSITTMGAYIVYQCDKLKSINIPTGMTYVPNGFASYCSALASVTIPEGVTNIGSGSFGFTALTEITFPSTLTVIKFNAFLGCPFTTMTLPASLAEIGSGVFKNCTGLTSITNNATTPQPIDASVFSGITTSNINLTVPVGTVNAYKANAVWGTLNVQGTDPTGIANNETSTVKLSVANGVMQVSNVGAMASVEVYNATGAKIASAMNTECATFDNLPQGIVMVKVIANDGISNVMKAMIK